MKKPPRKRAAKRKAKPAPAPDPAPAPAPSATPAEPPEPARSSSLPVPAPRPSLETVPRDALARYFAEVGRYPLLSREEELELATRVHDANDSEAAQKLVLSNLRLVVKIALEYRRVWTNLLDLIQEGNVGLLQGVRRFDPARGVKLASYASYWIRAYILKYLLDNIRLVRLGTTRAQRKLFFRLNREKRELERQGFEVEPRLIAERLEVPEAEVRDMEQRLAEPDLSLDAPVGREDGGAAFGDLLSGGGPSAEGQVADTELRQVFLDKVHAFADTLTDPRDRQIIEQRILAEEPKTLQELGDEFHVTRERVRQLEARLVSRLREYLKQNLVDFEYYAPGKE